MSEAASGSYWQSPDGLKLHHRLYGTASGRPITDAVNVEALLAERGIERFVAIDRLLAEAR